MEDLLELSKRICRENDIQPKKKHGQNFLINENVYDAIINSAELNKNDVVLEVGPGLGFLTEKLARIVKKVVTVEIDETLCGFLPTRFSAHGLKNVELINDDILRLSEDIKYNKIVANLPYNISARFLRGFLSKREAPELIVLMLQKEVVERICAKAPKMSILSVSVQYYAIPEMIQIVPKGDFWPEPKVESAIVRIAKKNDQLRNNKDVEKNFFQLVKFGFSSRRKMLKNNLSAGFMKNTQEIEEKLEKVGISKTARAQELSLDDWQKLLGTFS